MGMVFADLAHVANALTAPHTMSASERAQGVPGRHRVDIGCTWPALGHASAKMRPARSRSVKTAACTAALGRATVPSCRGTSRKQCQYGSEDYHFLLYQSLKPRQGQVRASSLTSGGSSLVIDRTWQKQRQPIQLRSC